jgi:hypothetical protein
VAPLNGFEEAIQYTNEGKLWNFPIDNEQGLNFIFILKQFIIKYY